MSDKLIYVNEVEDHSDEISLDQTDSIKNFTIVPNELIRDTSISPNCRWLIIYLISNDKSWNIKTRQLCNHLRGFMGRDKVLKLIREAIEAGYMKRDVILRKMKRGAVQAYKYTVASTPKFKNSLRQPDFQGTDLQCTDFQGTEDKATKEYKEERIPSLKKDIPKGISTSYMVPPEPAPAVADGGEIEDDPPPKKKNDFSAEVIDLTEKMIEVLSRHSPFYRRPKKMQASWEAVHDLLKGSVTQERILEVLTYAVKDTEAKGTFPGWSVVIYTKAPIIKFCEKAQTIEKSIKSMPKREFCASSDQEKSRQCVEDMMKDAL